MTRFSLVIRAAAPSVLISDSVFPFLATRLRGHSRLLKKDHDARHDSLFKEGTSKGCNGVSSPEIKTNIVLLEF